MPTAQPVSWTAQVLESETTTDTLQARVLVQFSNGPLTQTQDYRFNGLTDIGAALQAEVTAELNRLNAVSAFTPPAGTLTATVATPPVVDTTAQSLAQAIALLNSAQRAVNLGVITTAAAEYQSALSNVKTLYQAKYLGLF